MPDNNPMQPLLVEIAIAPNSRAGQTRLDGALGELIAKDASLQASFDRESGQTILKGESESHLEGKIDALRRAYGIGIKVGAPQVVFLEHPTSRAEVEYIYKKVSGSSGQFAAVKLGVEPNELGKGYQFESRISDGGVPSKYFRGIEDGVKGVLMSGVVAGFPVVDVKVELIDGKYHDVDSSLAAFEIASRAAFREALTKAQSILLEPVMTVEIRTPAAYAAPVADDMRRRRGGMVNSQDIDGAIAVIDATAPLASMFGYANSLRSISEGCATFTMRFARYAPAPTPEDDPPFRPAVGMRA